MGAEQSKHKVRKIQRSLSKHFAASNIKRQHSDNDHAQSERQAKVGDRSRRRLSAIVTGTKTGKTMDTAFSDSMSASSSSSSSRVDGGMDEIDTPMHDVSASASTTKKTRRRTRSMALQSSGGGPDESRDATDSATQRRIRRRTHDDHGLAGDAEQAPPKSQKMKEKERARDDEASSINTTVTATEGFTEDVENANHLPSSSSSLLSSAPHSFSPPNGNDIGSTSTADPLSDVERPQVTPPASGLANEGSTSATHDNSDARPDDDETRQRARVREIARALRSGSARQLVNAQGSSPERPTMLSALLSDILGLRGARSAISETQRTTTTGRLGDRTSSEGAPNGVGGDRSMRPGSGGTSVIVQGALVSRTLPSPNSSASRTTTTPSESAGDDGTAAASTDTQGQGADSALPDADAPLDPSTASVEGEAQAATVEEQASMLVRLLSIAAAATAASLLSSSASSPQRTAPANTTADGPSNASRPPMWTNATSSSNAPSEAPQPHVSSPSSSPTATRTSQEVHAASAWGSQTFNSLRSRIASLGNRLRGRSATAPGSETNAAPFSSSSARPSRDHHRPASFGGLRRVFDPPAAESPSGSVPAEPQRADAGDADNNATPPLASLSNMLRDAIRDGIQQSNNGRTRREATSPPSTRPRGASDGASAAQSRIHSVNATLQAVRDGQLTPGAEGSFDRFLFNLSSDLSVAVRGLPAHSSFRQGSTANDVANGDTGSGTSTAVNGGAEDDSARSRRQRDTQGGQLSFFRTFTFPENRSSSATDASSSSTLLPCILIGVRTLGANEVGGADTLAGFADAATATTERMDEPSDVNPESNASAQAGSDAAAANTSPQTDATETLTTGPPGSPPLSRYLLFVSGGHYPPQHPLFHASDDEASRDLMVLMEFLGAIAAFHIKPANTVTQEEITKSKLRTVNGTRSEIETLTKLRQIMENTSERCLICLEDWQDENDGERRLLDCGHLFHAACLDQWLVSSNNSCPLCRRQAVHVDGHAADDDAATALSGV